MLRLFGDLICCLQNSPRLALTQLENMKNGFDRNEVLYFSVVHLIYSLMLVYSAVDLVYCSKPL